MFSVRRVIQPVELFSNQSGFGIHNISVSLLSVHVGFHVVLHSH